MKASFLQIFLNRLFMVQMTVREALGQAMRQEMHRDKSVLIMGEEVAQYQGAYKITQGLLEEFGPLNTIGQPNCPPDM